MCGILAALTRRPIDDDRIRLALDRLEHRGPDGSGAWTSDDGRFTLGHTRLSIIGLDNGEQPLHSADGEVHAVVNGEFYGYRAIREQLRAEGALFATDSDSEIALHLYRKLGTHAASRLRGEFAVVLADLRRDALIAIRDRFGIKPLFYAVHDGEVFFASEIKALLALGVPARWDLDNAFLGFAGPHERTTFAGVRAVPPGSFAIARDGEVRVHTYWDWEFPTAEELARDDRSEEQIVDDFREVLRDAVRERLVADVEVACYLSGGIDSCAVLGLAQQEMDQPIRAFTLSFEEALYDEAAIARAQAELVGSSFEPIPITGRELADAYADAIWHTEIPWFNGHGVAKFLLSRAVRDAGIKVVFTGEGADEMLGGYPFFRVDAVNHDPALDEAERLELIDRMFEANEAARAIMMPQEVSESGLLGVESRLGWVPASVGAMAAMSDALAPIYRDEMKALLAKADGPFVGALDRLPVGQRMEGRNGLNQSLYLQSKTMLPSFILTVLGDRMEMAHSIEGRVPFLDHHVAEECARMPVHLKVKGMREKHVLREAAKDVLTPEVHDRQKHPFTSPPTRRDDDPMMEFYRDTFASQAARAQPLFDPDRAMVVLDELLTCAPDQSIAVEGIVQRAAGAIVMHERFGMA